MIPLETIAEGVASAKLYYIDLLNELLVELGKGCKPDTCKLQELQGLIRALTYDINDEVNDDTTQELYVKLLNETDGYYQAYVIDPNVVYPYYPVGSVETEWGKIGGNILNQTDLVAYIESQASEAGSVYTIERYPSADDGTVYVVNFPEIQEEGVTVDWVCLSGGTIYKVNNVASDNPKRVSINYTTGDITWSTPFYEDQYAWLSYKQTT